MDSYRPPAAPGAGAVAMPIDRRRFLALAGSAAAWTVLQPVLTAPAWARHIAAAPVALQPWWLPAEAPAGAPRGGRALFPFSVRRRTNRLDYDGRAILMEHAAQLAAQASDGVRLHWLDDRSGIQALADLAHDATRATVLDRRAEAERFAW